MKPQQNNLLLEINLLEGKLPIFSDIKFKDLSANAVVKNGEAVFSDFFAHIHNGTITGKGNLNWSNGWRLQGQVNARNINLQSMLPGVGISGELLGEINISLMSPSVSQLDKDYRLEGSFEAKNGEIDKIDVEAVARFGVRPGVAGHTNFSELAGTVKADSRGQQFYLSKFASAASTSTGVINVDDNQQLSGRLLVDVKGPGNDNIPLQISGTTTEPILQAGR